MSSRGCPLSASVTRNSLPARTSSTPSKPSVLNECWIAFPCGSRTDGLSSTMTVAFMVANDTSCGGTPRVHRHLNRQPKHRFHVPGLHPHRPRLRFFHPPPDLAQDVAEVWPHRQRPADTP